MGSEGYYYRTEEAMQGQNLFQSFSFYLERITFQSKSKTFSHNGKTKYEWAMRTVANLGTQR
jgi:hypothetical protein